MKAILILPALYYFISKGAAAPQTLTSTLILNPIPLSTINITPSAHPPPPTAYSTGRATGHGSGIGTALGTGGPRTANYTLLSITLHYRTTLQTQRTYPTLSHPSNGSYHYPNATGISPPMSNSTRLPTPPPNICTPNDIYCNSFASFSLCVPGAGNSTTYYPMGSVANGTVCRDGAIERASDGKCTPNGTLSCSQNGQVFFLCDEGGLINMGSIAPGTRCMQGQIVVSAGLASY
ncbi:hypothetical protein N7G274_002914 [Stereocaulon virgatum]|uniref:Uncharacterized protein n=1 Tax=Stereocaulon virgatum TaxID=373712 RepID=A0ABR4AHL0_9LECA